LAAFLQAVSHAGVDFEQLFSVDEQAHPTKATVITGRRSLRRFFIVSSS